MAFEVKNRPGAPDALAAAMKRREEKVAAAAEAEAGKGDGVREES